ncbi:MAG TPA: serine hydrolase domain-containing protein [Polyangiaceae bacterium]|nr:serine hydrolase domain-containing protein [Polyangiaceae bacterium]
MRRTLRASSRPLRALLFAALAPLVACDPAPAARPARAPVAALRPARFTPGALPPPAFADPARKQKLLATLPEVERLVADEFRKQKLPGLAAGLVIDGELVWTKGYGVRDLASRGPVDADTVFRIASMTKSFTGVAVLQLRDAGKLRLDDPAAQHVPELARLAYPTRDAAPITLRDLLTHGGGLPEDNPWGDRQLGLAEDAFTALLREGFSFSSSPGTHYEYSNTGFAMLGRAIARASGRSYHDWLTGSVLRPLGMGATTLDESAVPRERLARGHRREGEAFVPEPNLPDGAYGAMGGLFSSVRDMARYLAFHLDAWPPRDDPESGPLSRASRREMHQPARHVALRASPGGVGDKPAGASSVGYGYGFRVADSCDLSPVVSHGGGLPGYGSTLAFLPEHGVGFVALGNVTYARLGDLGGAVLRALAAGGGLDRRAVAPAPALVAAHASVARLLERWDDAEASAAFADTFFLDVPRPKLVAQLEALRRERGRCSPAGPLEPENALRGARRFACERGWVEVRLTLTPPAPTRIQALTVEGHAPPSPALADAAARLVALASSWEDAAAERLLDPSLDRAALKKRLSAVAAARGACRVERPLGGDGRGRYKALLACERAPVALDLRLAEASGRVSAVEFEAPPGPAGKCAQ